MSPISTTQNIYNNPTQNKEAYHKAFKRDHLSSVTGFQQQSRLPEKLKSLSANPSSVANRINRNNQNRQYNGSASS